MAPSVALVWPCIIYTVYYNSSLLRLSSEGWRVTWTLITISPKAVSGDRPSQLSPRAFVTSSLVLLVAVDNPFQIFVFDCSTSGFWSYPCHNLRHPEATPPRPLTTRPPQKTCLNRRHSRRPVAMATQAALIADTIVGMKRALRREREGK